MRVFLMHPILDFDVDAPPLQNESDLVQDLGLETIFHHMADNDEQIVQSVSRAIPDGLRLDQSSILWRQEVLKDCIENEDKIRELYALANEPLALRKKMFLTFGGRSPTLQLMDCRKMLDEFHTLLEKTSNFSIDYTDHFKSKGFIQLFQRLSCDLLPEYLFSVKRHLKELEFPNGMLFSGKLGLKNEAIELTARYFKPESWAWLKEFFGNSHPHYQFQISPRDESSSRELGDIQDEVLKGLANVVSQASQHIEAFFRLLRIELAFYIGCINLKKALTHRGVPLCFPTISQRKQTFKFCDLRDASLCLVSNAKIIGNDLEAANKAVVMVTGANQGGKSTYLRSIGIAQLMMQAGMFVTAKNFEADIRDAIFTHYRRPEDSELISGKFDEELKRLDSIISNVDKLPLFLFNESFAATNEREGSEVAKQVISALSEF